MSIPTQVNVPESPFNSSTRVYNGGGVEARAYRYITALPPAFNDVPAGATGPRVLTEFAATTDDLNSNAVVVTDVTDTVPRTPLIGSFAAIRARRILHQYRVGFWGDSGIINQLAASTESDPSQTTIDTNWDNFQLFSYLPSQLMPTKEQFSDLITPSKNAANVRDSLSKMGISTAVVTNPAPVSILPPPTSLPGQTPFATNLSQFCAP